MSQAIIYNKRCIKLGKRRAGGLARPRKAREGREKEREREKGSHAREWRVACSPVGPPFRRARALSPRVGGEEERAVLSFWFEEFFLFLVF
jgi:hypothetical protein